eukprot:2443197-Pyramimonas_sp.AAC.2
MRRNKDVFDELQPDLFDRILNKPSKKSEDVSKARVAAAAATAAAVPSSNTSAASPRLTVVQTEKWSSPQPSPTKPIAGGALCDFRLMANVPSPICSHKYSAKEDYPILPPGMVPVASWLDPWLEGGIVPGTTQWVNSPVRWVNSPVKW